MNALELVQDIWRRTPNGRAKSMVLAAVRNLLPAGVMRHGRTAYALVQEISKLDIAECGVDAEGDPFIVLSDGVTYFSQRPAPYNLQLHERLPRELHDAIPGDCIRVAVDLVCRWKYPHALVGLTPPYSYSQRVAFHPQHRDTIDDLQLTSQQNAEMKSRFAIQPGDMLLDVGGYVGLGAMKLASLVAPTGRVVSIEAHPDNHRLFAKNLATNRIENVQLLQMGVWKEPGSLELRCTQPEDNTLVEGVFARKSVVQVRTDSIDNIASEQQLTRCDLVSLTINGAEVEAIEGMSATLARWKPKLSVAGWYKRDGRPVHHFVTELLDGFGYRTIVGPCGRVYAWHPG